MSPAPRSYFGAFFTRQYWRTLGHVLFAAAFTSWTIRETFWERVDSEADSDMPPSKPDRL
jgi:hypothetical protein